MASSEANLQALPMTHPTSALVPREDSWNQEASKPVGVIDRLSAVPSSGMVRDPNFLFYPKKRKLAPSEPLQLAPHCVGCSPKVQPKSGPPQTPKGPSSDPRLQSQPLLTSAGEPLPKPKTQFYRATLQDPQPYFLTTNFIFLLRFSENSQTGILGG